MGAKKAQTVGFWYYLGMHFGLCRGPVDALVELRGGNRKAWSGSQAASGRITINAPDLYGGEKAEGGIAGDLDVMMGETTQQPNDYLTSAQGGPQPAYRGLCSAVYRRGKVGAFNPYPKPWAFRLQRALKGWDNNLPWYPEKAIIALPGGIKAMNPAHILYETITDRRWGMGEPRSLIADAWWRAQADILHAEGLGLCLVYEPTPDAPILDFQQTVIDHIGAALTQSRADGLYYLDLVRPIADPASLPALSEADVIEITVQPNPLVDAVNEIRVEWRDPLTNTDRVTTPVQALGNITSIQGVISETRRYRGLASEEIALRVALRDLNARALPLMRLQATVNRALWDRRPGQAVRVTLPGEGLVDAVFRLGEIDFGQHDDGRMRVTLVQDVFSFPAAVYAQPQASLWTPPDPTPVVPPIARVDEASYVELAAELSPGDRAVLPADAGFLSVSAARPSGSAVAYGLSTSAGGAPFVERGTGDWSPSAVLAQQVSRTATVLPVVGAFGLDRVELGTAARIGDEIVRVDAISLLANTVTVGRGCADTVPTAHAAGAFVWFDGDFAATDGIQYSDGETVSARVLTRTPSLQIADGETLEGSVLMASRADRPYPPGMVRINGAADPAFLDSPITVTWAHRDRLLQDDQLIDQTVASIGPEPGTQYRLIVEQPVGSLVSDQITATLSGADVSVVAGVPARVLLRSSRNGVLSRFSHEYVVGVGAALPQGASRSISNGGFENSFSGWSLLNDGGGVSSATLSLETDPDLVISGQVSGRLQRPPGGEVTFVRAASLLPVLMGTQISLRGSVRRLGDAPGTISIAVAIRVSVAGGNPLLTIIGGNLFSDFTNLTPLDAGQIVSVPRIGDNRSLQVPFHPDPLVFDAGVLVQSPVAPIDLILDDFVVNWFEPT